MQDNGRIPINLTPLPLPEVAEQVEDMGRKTYHALGCSGIARVDFLIDPATKRVYVVEVNTLPGSLYAHNWKKVGVSGVDLVTKLVTLAEERFEARQHITLTFTSDILKGAGGMKTT